MSNNPLGMTDVLGLAANGGGRLTLPPDGGFPDTWLNNANQYGYDVGEVMDGLIAVPKPVADSAYLQKVDAVLTEAIFQLSNNPDYGGDAALVAFAEQLRQDAPWIMGGLAGIMALSALPPPVGVTLSTSLVVAGVTMVGLDGILFLSDLVDTLGAVSSIPGCDGAALQKQGEELARRIFDVGLEVAEGAIIGTLGAVGKIANKVKTLNSDAAKKVSDGLSKEVSGDSLDELVEDVGRNIGVPSNALNSQLIAEEVAKGHAFQKHVIERGEFSGLDIRTRQQFQNFIEKIVANPFTPKRYAADGTIYYLDYTTKTVIIRGQRGEATAFRPDFGVGWDNYLNSSVPKNTNPPAFDSVEGGRTL